MQGSRWRLYLSSASLFNVSAGKSFEGRQPKYVDPVPLQSIVGTGDETQVRRNFGRPIQVDHPIAVTVGHKRRISVISEDNFAIYLNASTPVRTPPRLGRYCGIGAVRRFLLRNKKDVGNSGFPVKIA